MGGDQHALAAHDMRLDLVEIVGHTRAPVSRSDSPPGGATA